ncbi:SHD1 domain-containing protein [Mariniblastus fucicola]|uniref:SLA1 homology domain-containing protein n=1 Tax=Mariniblastus fucicola TaxID=980251 RepID=A0A5B9PAW6_9BACT|nr:SHD1 domain-containing protein [Mariniblastus fucicola]QEG21666.1 hypothetical protein MFFC18_15240 [Mariniblastus fucicola]
MKPVFLSKELSPPNRLRLIALLTLVSLFTCVFPAELSAQRRRTQKASKTPKTQIGDIIYFEDGIRYADGIHGLIVNMNRSSKIDLEIVNDEGEIEAIWVLAMGNFSWELVHRYESEKKMTVRTWKSEDGKFEIRAKMVRVESKKIRLEKEDGKSIAVPIDRLSQKDQDYIAKNSDGSETVNENPFDVADTEEFPEDVVMLMERRRDLVDRDIRHQRLAKLSPEMAIGDILQYESRRNGSTYGIVTKLGFFSVVESINEHGELEDDRGFSKGGRWTYFDRQFIAVPMLARTWKSANGKFNLTATLVEVDGDEVVLKKEDGSTMKIALSKLSDSDQTYAARAKKRINVNNDEQLVAERESYSDDLLVLLKRRAEVLKDASLNFEIARDTSRMKSIRLRTGPIKQSGSGESVGLANDSFSLRFPLRAPQNARVENVSYAKASGLLALTAASSFRGKPTLAIVDVESREVITNENGDDIGHEGEVIAISPSGKTLLISSKVVFDRQVELWRFEDGELSKHGTVSFDSFQAPQAHLISDTRGVILSTSGNMTFFDITDRIKPTHQLSVGRFGGRRGFQIAGGDQNCIYILDADTTKLYAVDVETKTCLGGVNFNPKERSSIFSFAQVNPDGKSVVYMEQSRMSVYSLATGKVVSEKDFDGSIVPISSGSNSQFQYLGDDLILTSSGAIFDLDRGLEIGNVDGGFRSSAKYFADGSRLIAEANQHGGGGSFGNEIGGRRGSRQERVSAINSMREDDEYETIQTEVRVERLPIDKINDFVANFKQDDIVTFGKGDSVEVVVRIDGTKKLSDELADYIEDIMAGDDIDIARKSDFVLELTYTVGKREQKTFNVIGFGPRRTRKASLIPKRCAAVLKYRGETVWSQVRSASLNVGSEEALDNNIKLSKELSAEALFDFNYPTSIRKVLPSRKGKFRWE